MNIEAGKLKAIETAEIEPTEADAKAALETLQMLARTNPALAADMGLSAVVSPSDALSRRYPDDFQVDPAYKASLPDLQNGPSSLIKGASTDIQHVGISNFRLPLDFRTRDGGPVTLETSVTGSVSLDAQKKGINMSRIMRSFYRHAGTTFDHDRLSDVLDSYLQDLESADARIMLRFRYPMLRASLRSGLEGYQYYDTAFEMLKTGGQSVGVIHFDYVYSSTCPCSLELSEHARITRGQIATPHSQRSVARLSLRLSGDETLWLEDLAALCLEAIPTETQVMVKREDEQAFAELNGSNPIFVEDAVRLLCEALAGDPRIGDFRVVASHQESLHSHDAVSILSQGPTFAQTSYDPRLFESIYHVS